MSHVKVEYRSIAKLLCQNLPVEGADYTAAVETSLASIKRLPAQARLSMRVAYVFASKVPREEREDCFQTFTATLLGTHETSERFAYAAIRADWLNWWARYKIRQHTSLDSVVQDDEGNATTLGDLVVGEVEFEQKLGSDMDAATLWARIPDDIKPLVLKRLEGRNLVTRRERGEPIAQPLVGKNRREYARFLRRGRPTTGRALTDCERQRFNRWVHKSGVSLLLTVN